MMSIWTVCKPIWIGIEFARVRECLYAETEYQESQYARSDEASEAEIGGIAGKSDGKLKSSEGPPGSPPGLSQAGSSKAELSKPSNPQCSPGQGGRAKVPESKHWRAITEAVRALPDHKTMSKQEWQASLRIYLAWIHQQGRAGREKKIMKLGHQWTTQLVIHEECKERLKEIILEKYGAASGSVEMLWLYQTELNEIIDKLSKETWLEAGRTAEDKKFAVEMWKKGGIRMIILLGFKDEKREILAQKKVGKPKKSQGRCRDDVVKKVLLPDGTNLSCAYLQDLVRGFLMAHYRIATQKPRWNIPDDPSHLKCQEALHFLEFIWNRQALFLNNIFKFQCPHPLVTTDDDEEAPTHSQSSKNLRAELDNYDPLRKIAKEKKGQLGEGNERAEQAHHARIKYGLLRNIPKEKPTSPPDHRNLRARLDHIDDAQIKYGLPRKVPKEKCQLGEGSWQGREPTPPPNHQDLMAELDNYGPPRKVPKEKGQLGEGSQQRREPAPPEHRDRRAELDQANNTLIKLSPPRKVPQEKGQLGKGSQGRELSPEPDERDQGPYQEHAESDLLQKVQKEEGPEAERSQQRREPTPAIHGRDNQSEIDANDTQIKDKAREASLDEGDCMEQSKDDQIKYGQLKKDPKTTGDEGEGSQEKRKPTPWPDQREKRAEPDHVEDTCIKYGPLRKRREPSPQPIKRDGRAEINYPEDDHIKKGLTSRLVHRQQEAQVEEEHQTDIRVPADYARKDTTQGNMETIGDSSFDGLPLFYANAGLASNKTIAKPVYQDNKVADLGRVPLKSAMKKPSYANNEGRNGEQGVIDYQIAENSNIGREKPVSDLAETLKNILMSLVDETAQITPRCSGCKKRAPLSADAKYEILKIPVGMKCRSDQREGLRGLDLAA
ncbi:hypothetical protein EV363DRAFT_1404641 [Boletus edulis]|nr:hypothetical protein EV363DRAFT_1404641 [Boletus edulis]